MYLNSKISLGAIFFICLRILLPHTGHWHNKINAHETSLGSDKGKLYSFEIKCFYPNPGLRNFISYAQCASHMLSIIIIIGIIFVWASFPIPVRQVSHFPIREQKPKTIVVLIMNTTDFQSNEQKCICTISNNNKGSASSSNGYEKKKKKKWMVSLLSSVLRTWIGYILRIKSNTIDIMITFIRRVCYPFVSISFWLFVSFVYIRI